MFKNIRYLLSKIGTTDFSSIGSNTVTGALGILNNNLTVSNAGITVTRTSGATITSVESYKYGKIVQVRIAISSTGVIAPGNNLFTGTLSGLLPKVAVTTPGYQAKAHYTAYLTTDGAITCRVLGSNSIDTGPLSFSFIYITN